ncbi:MAG: DUF3261 domain-containing protein [Treponema sp.]|nr:DUF3261 domain-containing protein [Treponema sp.]
MLHSRKYSIFVSKLSIICYIIPTILLVSCTSTKINPDTEKQVYLTDRAAVTLLPTTATENTIQMFQSLTGNYSGKSFQMDAFLILNQDEIHVTLLNSFGTTMGTLLYTPSTLTFDSPVLPRSIKPAYIAFDFQLCFYSEEDICHELEKAGFTLKTATKDEQQLREVYEGNRLIISILKEKEKIQFVNKERNYSYIIYGDFDGIK